MRIFLIPKAELSDEFSQKLVERIAAKEHEFDKGPIRCWNQYSNGTLYAFFHRELKVPVAIADASGPSQAVNAGWWIDSKFRGQKYGRELADLLSGHLKAKGYTGVGYIRIDTHNGEYDQASISVRKRFRAFLLSLIPPGWPAFAGHDKFGCVLKIKGYRHSSVATSQSPHP